MSPIFSPLSSFSSILLLLGVLISLEPFPMPSHRIGDTQLHLTYMRVAVAVVPVEKLRQYTIITVEYRFLLLFKTAGCPKSYRGNLPDDAFRGRNTQCKSQLTGDAVDRLGYLYGNTIVANSINLTLFLSAILCHCWLGSLDDRSANNIGQQGRKTLNVDRTNHLNFACFTILWQYRLLPPIFEWLLF